MLRVGDVETAAEDAVLRNDEGVVRLGAEQHQRIEPGAALDVERRIDVVFDRVVAGAALDVEVRARRDEEGAHDERIVAAAADHREISLVRIDLERVEARAAIEHGRLFHAVGEIAEGRQRRRQPIADPGADVARRRADSRRVVDLPDLEEIIAVAGVDGHQSRIAVDGEIIAIRGLSSIGHQRSGHVAAVDLQAICDRFIVIDALVGRLAVRAENGDKIVAHQERLPGDRRRAVDDQRVQAVVERAAVIDVDDVIRVDRGVDNKGVPAIQAVEIDDVRNLAVETIDRRQRRHARHVVDVDRAVAAAGVDVGDARKRRRAELDVAAASARCHIENLIAEGAEEIEGDGVAVEGARRGEVAAVNGDRRARGELRGADHP